MEKIFALDLGTTKFCIGFLQFDKSDSSFKIKTVTVASEGMNKGMIADFHRAQKSLTTLIDLAETEFNCDIDKITLGVSGPHLKSRFIIVNLPIDNEHIVKPKTLEKIKENLRFENQDEKREIIHISPCNYQIDDREWVINPIGFSGVNIKAKFFIIEADRYYLSDMVRLCNSCGISVSGLISEQFASSKVTVDSSKKDLGVVLLDIGGGTTDGMIFLNGKPSKIFTATIGGNLMTKDLSIGLGISFDEAERIKIISGLSREPKDHVWETIDLRGKPCKIDQKLMSDILKARIEELALLVKKEIASHLPLLQGGIILTGGGSEIKDICSLFEEIIKLPVEKIDPIFRKSEASENDQISKLAPKYATVLGLLHHEFTQRDLMTSDIKIKKLNNAFLSFVKFIKELY